MRHTQYLRSGAALMVLAFAAAAAPAWSQVAPSAPAPAKSPAANETVQLEDVVVTARRRDERLLDAPVAITAIGGQAMKQYSVTRVTDLATLVPSLVAGKAASGSSASIFLRGVGSTALSAGFDQSVSFVIDGLPMSRGREISLPQYDVQGVEVLKGPQALFFGKNTTGGLISITSNGPTDTFEAGLKGGYGVKAREKYVEGFVSGPLSDTLSARLAGRYSDSEGAFTNTAAATYATVIPGQVRTRNSDRRGGAESGSARLSVDWKPTDAFDATLKTGFTTYKDGGPTDLIERICPSGATTPSSANGIPPSPNADCSVNGRSDSSSLPVQVAQANYRYARDGKLYSDFGSQYAVINANLRTGVFDINSITGYYHFHQTDLNNVSGEAYPASFSQLADFTQYSQEIRFQSRFDGPFNVMFGGFAAHGEFEFNTDAYIFPVTLDTTTGTYTTFKRDDGFDNDAWSLFLQGTYNITPALELSGGARFSHEVRDSYQRSLNANNAFAAAFPGGIVLNDHYKDHNLSPEVTLRYKPATDTTLYVSYKQGFKAGGFNISQALTAASTVDAGRYGAETAKGGEVGFRSLLLDRRLRVGLTAYHYAYSNLQVQFFDPTTVSLTAGNAGKLVTQGLEGDFNYAVPALDGLTLRGAVALNKAEYKDYVGQCYPGQTIAEGCNLLLAGGVYNGQNYDGRTPPKAPKSAGRLGATYEAGLPSDMSLRFSGDLAYTSKYNYTDALRPDSIQKAFTKVDAAVTLNGPGERWSLSLIGRNLTNKLVVTAANDIPFAGGVGTGSTTGVRADMSAFIDNPREILLEAALKF
jgi:outer membrane receptor protein involved in Fe transport